MSRTYRNLDNIHRYALRRPKTSNERRNIIGLLKDIYIEGYKISGLNHLHHRLSNCPTAWDDKVINGFLQEDYKVS